MRLAVYGAVSTLAASGVVISAFAQRANFYSATVYLAQSNACLMILTNFSLLCSLIFAHILQRILYGPLRDLEVESLYEKAWYAVTETCLAMTIFRDEWNVGFVLCFAGLLFAKGFCWLSSGRVEMMEQTPPANPRLFHTRLIASLLLLISSDLAMVYYAVSDVLETGKPGMMVMFAFEFTILLITALSTAGRYGLIMTEKFIVHKQANARRLARQAERAAAAVQRAQDGLAQGIQHEDEEEEELDLVWEEKGTWMFYLELATDFLKLLTYLAFFFIVLTFYGLPLHIIRDVYITLRSFISRIRDFIRYRRATNDMNVRYPDATVEEVERENVCIICREEMRPYIHAQGNQGAQGVQAAAQAQQRQRMRPKKLPCGHILHFACLRSWLERQQRCPTCRRPVLEGNQNAANPNAPQQAGGQQAAGRGGGGIAWGGQFGGIRVNFGVGQGPEFMQNLVQQWDNRPQGGNPGPVGGPAPAPAPAPQNLAPQQEAQQGNAPTETGLEATPLQQTQQIEATGTSNLTNLRGLHIQLLDLERRLRRELEAVETLNTTLGGVRNLRARLTQVRQQQQQTPTESGAAPGVGNLNQLGQTAGQTTADRHHTSAAGIQQNLPPALQGLNLPAGWQVIPLTPVGVGIASPATAASNQQATSYIIPSAAPPSARPAVGTFPTTLADLRRRRFGRGDVRNYNANLRDYHAVQSPSLEQGEAEGGLAGQSGPLEQASSSSNSGSTGQEGLSDLQRRLREVFQDNLALDESAALLASALREMELAPTNTAGVSDSTQNSQDLTEEYVSRLERETGVAIENRRALIGLAQRILDEARQGLEQRRSRAEVADVPWGGTSAIQTSPQQESNSNVEREPVGEVTAAEGAQAPMTPTGSSSSSGVEPSSVQDRGTTELASVEAGSSSTATEKGKGKAATVESDIEED
ncbi:hypothetical protein BDZ91DRAFT_479751 [Kalaharituber pfeilii]|nr:hypothetical protein BDZ91DRAFT_479751 [Kalaharituber pfeilii]